MNILSHLTYACDAAGTPHSGTRKDCESLQVALIREGKHPFIVPMGSGVFQIGLAGNQKEARTAEQYLANREAVKRPDRGLRSVKLN